VNVGQYVRVSLQQMVDAMVMQRLQQREHLELLRDVGAQEGAQSGACLEGFQPLMILSRSTSQYAYNMRERHVRIDRCSQVAARQISACIGDCAMLLTTCLSPSSDEFVTCALSADRSVMQQ